jgi:hypothetical protein
MRRHYRAGDSMSNDIPIGLEAVELTGKQALDLLASAFDFAEVETVPMELEPTERDTQAKAMRAWRDQNLRGVLGERS